LEPTTQQLQQPVITDRTLAVMAVAAGIAVANLYYNQPLLADIERTFHASPAAMGWVPMLTQIGYALGMFFFTPLGDFTERRRLIVLTATFSVPALVLAAVSRNLPWMALASLAVGTFSVAPQLLVPMAANLTAAHKRGRAVGTVMSGLLVGILVARTISGIIGEHFGWRAMFWVAAAVMALLTVALRVSLPASRGHHDGTYAELMLSLRDLVRSEPVLRESAVVGAMLFGAFSVFWASMVFFVEAPPYGYQAQTAGLFGVIGVTGALAAPIAGRISDRSSARTTLRLCVVLIAASFLLLLVFGHRLVALIIGIVLLDAGVQGGHVSNLSRIYSLTPKAHNRLNTVYMVSYFAGGALGSSLGTLAWAHWNWPGVCALGMGFMVLAGAVLVRHQGSAT
jgi:predicted MFS family arabinose efflux permease